MENNNYINNNSIEQLCRVIQSTLNDSARNMHGHSMWEDHIMPICEKYQIDEDRWAKDKQYRYQCAKEYEEVFPKFFRCFSWSGNPNNPGYSTKQDKENGDLTYTPGGIRIDVKIAYINTPIPATISEESFKSFRRDGWYLLYSFNGKYAILVQCEYLHKLVEEDKCITFKSGYIRGYDLLTLDKKFYDGKHIFKFEVK